MPDGLEPDWPTNIICVLNASCLNTSQILVSSQPLGVWPLQSHVAEPGGVDGLCYLPWYQEEADGEPIPGQVRLHHGLWLRFQEPAGQALDLQGRGSWQHVWWSLGSSNWGTRHQADQRRESTTLQRQSNAAVAPWVKQCVGDKWFLSLWRESLKQAPRGRFQGVSQDVKSYLPSSPHSVEQEGPLPSHLPSALEAL